MVTAKLARSCGQVLTLAPRCGQALSVDAGSLVNYSIDEIKDEARHLVEIGKIGIHQPICILCEFIPLREWICAECELERNDYLLRDHNAQLVWANLRSANFKNANLDGVNFTGAIFFQTIMPDGSIRNGDH